jgi:hypothetical protein
MRKVFVFILTVLALLFIVVGAYVWLNDLVISLYGYRSPLKGTPPLTEDTSRALTSQVVLVLIDGLRHDASLQMPNLNLLRQQGAHATLTSVAPSNALTAWTTIVSGAGPEINDAPTFDPSLEWISPMAVDHLFAAANRSGLRSGIAGSQRWEKLIPPELLYTRFFVNAGHAVADEQVIDNALVFLKEFQPDLLLVHLQQVDEAGQKYGATSDEYRQAAARCDQHIGSLVENMDLRRSVLLVVSSYGQLDVGGHGGEEAVLLNTPLAMMGQNVLPGDYGEVRQTDIAPAIAALLGTPVPSAAEGSMQVGMLTMNAVDRAEKLVALASQRARLGSIYLYSIGQGPLRETAEGDMLVAVSSLQVKNYESAAELASLSVQQTDKEMLRARRSQIWKERTQRAVPLAAVVLIFLWIIWLSRSKRTALSLAIAGIAVAVYHTLFLWQGNNYSFSQIPVGGLAATFAPSLQRAAVATSIGAVLIVWREWAQKERSIFAVVMRTYGYAGLQLYLIALLIGACTWWNGPQFSWYLPSFTIAYVQFAGLMQAMLVGILAVLLPIPVVILQRALLAISTRYSSTARRAQRAARSK